MFVFVRAGTGLYGKVRSLDGTCVVTRFFHIGGFPIVPVEGHSRLVLREPTPGDPEGLSTPIPYDLRSLWVAYARCWGVVGLLALGVALRDGSAELASVLLPGVALLAVTLASYWVRIATPHERLEAQLYAEITGFPVDVRLAPVAQRLRLLHDLRCYLDDRARMLDGGYRHDTAWLSLAMLPQQQDRELLVAAFVALRLDETLAGAPGHEPLAGVTDHRARRAALLERVMALDPKLSVRAMDDDFEFTRPPQLPVLAWAAENAPPLATPPPRPWRWPSEGAITRGVGALVMTLGAAVMAAILHRATVQTHIPPGKQICLVWAIGAVPVGFTLLTCGPLRFTLRHANAFLFSLGVAVEFVAQRFGFL